MIPTVPKSKLTIPPDMVLEKEIMSKQKKLALSIKGWCSGDTKNQVSVSDLSWSRLGQFTASKVRLLQWSTRLICKQEANFTVAV